MSENPMVNDRAKHAKFAELCALYTGGALEREELDDLNEHLAWCRECRSLLAEYQTLATMSIPRLADDGGVEELSGFDRELAESRSRVFAEIDRQRVSKAKAVSGAWLFPGARIVQCAAFVIIGIVLTASGYFFGIRKSDSKQSVPPPLRAEEASLRNELQAVSHDRDGLKLLLELRDQAIQETAAAGSRQLTEIVRLRKTLELADAEKLQSASTIASLIAENGSLKSDRETANRELQRAHENFIQAQQELIQVRADRTAVQAEDWSRDKQISNLSAQISEQQRLLSADRDIRDLMGARDLLISDVIDVDTRGHNKKPFGRIFYTKNKSLVFYAFDLDNQPGLRNASAFQVWGARATSKGNESPVSMGVFYKDSATAQRWVLQFDDTKVLGQIDSVFVTAEPEGGSVKPSGRQFLFSYLRGEANHP